jgi:nucleotide-binding universal stress UspA family protein
MKGAGMRIAIPHDGSRGAQTAVRYVVNRAKREGPVEVEVVGFEARLVDEAASALALPLVPAGVSALVRVRDALGLFATHGIPCRLHRATGDPARAIARIAESAGCDEIVIGRLGASVVARQMLRSLPDRIARLARRRVTVVE